MRFAQVQHFLSEVERFARRNDDDNRHFPILLCGDFNSTPDSESVRFLTDERSFRSVYDLNDRNQISSSVNGELRLVDYIFFSKRDEDEGRLTLLERYEMYRDAELSEVFLPNHQFPSDHFAIGAKFAVRFLPL